MSRIGSSPVVVPDGVNIEVAGSVVKANGPKGALELVIPQGITVSVGDGTLSVKRGSESKTDRSNHGLIRSLIQNIVTGVSKGYEKKLEVHGVGYKVNLSGQKLVLNLGFSHPIEYTLPEGVSAAVEQNVITLSGIDKQQVGQAAAEIRALKKPEPYKGKGIRYEGEYIIRKSGKAALGGKE